MRLFLKIFLVWFVLIKSSFVWAQPNKIQKNDNDNQNDIELNIENIIENANNPDIDYTTLLENLNQYKENPINLNNTNTEQLKDLGLLSDIQINDLLKHIEKNGVLLEIFELQGVKSWDIVTIKKLLPYVYVNNGIELDKNSIKKIFTNRKITFDTRTQRILEDQAGYLKDSRGNAPDYLGDPFKHFVRLKGTSNKLFFGFTGEKDAGEEFFKGSQKQGFDYMSGYVSLKNFYAIKNIVVGDYNAQFGQGLCLWTDLAYGKTPDILLIKRTAKGIRPYNSINENQFLRGVAATLSIKKEVEFSVFVSSKKRDGNLTDTATQDIDGFTSFGLTGLHRTLGEIADKDALQENLVGGNLSYKTRTLSIGVTNSFLSFNKTFTPGNNLYQAFDFKGKENINSAVDYNYVFRNFNFFGETSFSNFENFATVNGLYFSLDSKLSLLVHYRNYQRNYYSFYARSVGEQITANNEKGTLIGFNYKPFQSLQFNGYVDNFTFPWLRYGVSFPSQGYDLIVNTDYFFSKKVQFNMRARYRVRQENSRPADLQAVAINDFARSNIRFNFLYSVSPSLRLKNRFEINSFQINGVTQFGYLFFQDLVFKKPAQKYNITFRYMIFNNQGFDTRSTVLETDLPYAYSFPSLIGTGTRFYTILNVDISKRFEFWVRYSYSWYLNAVALNVGTPNFSEGPLRTELKLQLRYKF
jgi:hypothetical protein